MKPINLKRYFDRVVLIHLRRRPDRLATVQLALSRCNWPFKKPTIVPAVDGLKVKVPPRFDSGPGAWGCLCSHREVLRQAMQDKLDSVLILEDDVCFVDGFAERISGFLQAIPDDWDQLMIGGQHRYLYGKPVKVRDGVYRTTNCERTHCYAVRGKYMRKLYERWGGGGAYEAQVHCDWIMARDPGMQLSHRVYSPQFFLAGQERSHSDNFGIVTPRQFWNPPGPDRPVINLHGSQPLVSALREHGWYTGNKRDAATDIDYKLHHLFQETDGDPDERKKLLHDWIKERQWEVGHDPDFVCTIWHPLATAALVKSSSLWKVFEVTATTVQEALKQIPPQIRRPRLPVFA